MSRALKMTNWLKNVRGVLLDISGTLHIGEKPTRDAVQSLKRLRLNGVTVKFITNATKESKSSLHAKLTRLGFDIQPDEIFTSLTATRRLIEAENLKPFCLLQDNAKEDFAGLETTTNPNAVVVGLAPDYFNYESLDQAFRLLVNNHDCRLIAVNKARYYQQSGGLSLGPGPFVEALEYASGKVATVVGKPELAFFQFVLKELGCRAEETVMIGDDVTLDVLGALQANLGGILVQTGKYRDGDEASLEGQPRSLCLSDFSTAVDMIVSAACSTSEHAASADRD